MKNLIAKINWLASVCWQLTKKELLQNWTIFLFPGLIMLSLWIFSQITSSILSLNAKISIAALVIAFIFAIIYGLQSFAGETDRKTMDFIQSRPIPTILLISVKFSLNFGFFLLWLFLSTKLLRFDWSLLQLPPGIETGIFMSLLVVLSMGFFSGLIVRGAERLIVTVLLASLLAGISYWIWNQAFLLMAASFYWFDIPPLIMSLVSFWLPLTLLIACLFTPLVFTLWFLLGRTFLLNFRPFRRILLFWFSIFSIVLISTVFLGPAVWPITPSYPQGGDWNNRSEITISGTFFKQHYPSKVLYIARYGSRPQPVYQGTQIHSPRWSPDSRKIVFVDGSQVKIWRPTSSTTLVKGAFPYWSHDGKSLVYSDVPDKNGLIHHIYRIDLKSNHISKIWDTNNRLLGLIWDSSKNRLYLLQEDKSRSPFIENIDLINQKTMTLPIESTLVLYMQNPVFEPVSNGNIFLGLSYNHKVQIFNYNPSHNELDLVEERYGHEIDALSQLILSPSGQEYLIPRIGGGYDAKGLIPPHEHHEGEKEEEEDN